MSCHVTPSNSDGSYRCHVCFVAREYAAGENGCRLDGHIVQITDVFTCNDANRSMRRHGYTRVVDN